jgi:hypothetical protein
VRGGTGTRGSLTRFCALSFAYRKRNARSDFMSTSEKLALSCSMGNSHLEHQ